jgi:hypothetical protein
MAVIGTVAGDVAAYRDVRTGTMVAKADKVQSS